MAEFVLVGGLGYLFGRAPFEKWQGFIDGYNKRLGHLAYNKVIEPLAFYKVENGKQIYGEGIYAYLFGLKNSALPSLFRCLELGLKQKYIEIENKKPTLTAFELIEWAETFLGKKKAQAHDFRFLRNFIHEEDIIEEQDALESIRHITTILNLLFPYPTANLAGNCQSCKNPYTITIFSSECYLGNTFTVQCEKCKSATQHTILPTY